MTATTLKKEKTLKKENTFGAVMMVTGCCVGAGMIGLPVLSAAAGFLPSFLAIFLAYAFTTGTGLLLLEATLWFEGRVNLLSIAEVTLGRFGKILVGGLFLFLFDGIFVSYFDGGGQIFNALLSSLFSQPVHRFYGPLLSLICVSAILYSGAGGVDRMNRFLMIGVAFFYCLILGIGMSHIELKNLEHANWKAGLATLPLLFICFGFQNMVPSLTHYLRKNVAAIRFSIVVGNFIPLLFYLLWNFVILGMISNPASLRTESGLVSELFAASGSIFFFIQAFSFFALFTSFITVGLSFVDFLRDAFHTRPREWVLQALVLLPPLAISLSIPHLFLKALSFAGGVIDVFLFGIFPICAVWIGRYQKKMEGSYRVAGGRAFLISMLALSVAFLMLRTINI